MPDVTQPGAAAGRSHGLVDILDLEQIETTMFRGRSRPGASLRVFGGEVAGQALVAAGRTATEGREVHSLHAYFLRGGDPSIPILYTVDPIRDGGSFSTRRVVAVQRGEAIFQMSASFQTPESGLSHQVPRCSPTPPERLPALEDEVAGADPASQAWLAEFRRRFGLEVRMDGGFPRLDSTRGEVRPPRQRFWLRVDRRLPDDPLLHQCAATYASDLFLLSSALPPHRTVIGAPGLQFASLDHAVWFHAPFRADEWLYYDQEGEWTGGGRGLSRGRLYDANGRLVASVMQEGLLRVSEGWAPYESAS